MNANVYVFAKVRVAGTHYWPDAATESENHKYLFAIHRHLFYIKVTMRVAKAAPIDSGQDVMNLNQRSIEFLQLQSDIFNALMGLYGFNFETQSIRFGTHSCETIAALLLQKMDAYMVEVSEDDENGAIIQSA